MRVHPSADLFPMLSESDLAELADDIKANGLRFPIVIANGGEEKVLIDGRNRLKACELAGVEPSFVTYDGDADAYIVSANINRRHMSKGARAMAVAMIYPEPTRLRRSGSSPLIIKELNEGFLSMARTILRVIPSAAPHVLSGVEKLKPTYDRAMVELRATATITDRLKHLRELAPDLAARVDGTDITIDEAETLQRERIEARKRAIDALQLALGGLTDRLRFFSAESPEQQAAELGIELSSLKKPIMPKAVRAGLANVLNYLEGIES